MTIRLIAKSWNRITRHNLTVYIAVVSCDTPAIPPQSHIVLNIKKVGSKMKNRIVILAALFLVIVLIVGLILIKNHIPNNDTGNTYYNSISAKNIFDVYSVASEVLSESNLEQTTSFTDEEQEFISQNFHLTYSIAEEENTLTVEEIDENISNFQNDYLNF